MTNTNENKATETTTPSNWPDKKRNAVDYFLKVFFGYVNADAIRDILDAGFTHGQASRDAEYFKCCGGNDEKPKEHCQDCEVYGNVEWLTKMHAIEVETLETERDELKTQLKNAERDLKDAVAQKDVLFAGWSESKKAKAQLLTDVKGLVEEIKNHLSYISHSHKRYSEVGKEKIDFVKIMPSVEGVNETISNFQKKYGGEGG